MRPVTRLLFLLAFCLMASAASAQSVPKWAEPGTGVSAAPADNLGGGPPPPPPPPPQVPIDGGLGLLAVAGGAYAARRLRRRDGEPDADD